MNKKYIIFDFDGTLANTNNIIIASWQATFEHYLGHTLPVREIEATFGEILVNTIGRLIPDAPVNEVVDYYRAYQDSHQQDYEVYVFEGIRELLEQLRERGCIIGVGTSRTAYSFWNYMKKLGMDGYVDEAVTMNDVTSHKPDPETIDAVLIKMMAHAGEAYDSGSGIPDAVRKAALMVGWSHYVDEEDMLADGFVPTYRMERPEQLLEII